MMKKLFSIVLAAFIIAATFAGCSSQNKAINSNAVESSSTPVPNTESKDSQSGKPNALQVRFGRDSKAFTLRLNDNVTAAEIGRYVGQADWNLPIYHFNDFENYEVMQYYDIPSSYKITSNPETVTSEKAGEVYYSAPNRILLFYQDGKVSGKFTKVGYLENTEGLKEAVEKNPVVEGWGNKIVSISPAK